MKYSDRSETAEQGKHFMVKANAISASRVAKKRGASTATKAQDTTPAKRALTQGERSAFDNHRARLLGMKEDWLKKAAILRDIRDRRLYRENWPTFFAFCRQELEMGKSNVNRLLQSAEVATLLATKVAPVKVEAHVRPLLRLTGDAQQVSAFHRAVQLANNAGKTLTGTFVARAVREITDVGSEVVRTTVTKADVLTRITRGLTRGLEKLPIEQLEKFESAVVAFKSAWLQAQQSNAQPQLEVEDAQ